MRLIRFRAKNSEEVALGSLSVDGDSIAVLEASSTIEWLRGGGRRETGERVEALDATILAPLDRPLSFRDFSAFEGHTRNGLAAAAKMLPAGTPPPEFPSNWFETPGFYFSNPAAFRGPGEPVARPAGSEWLDFELEIGAVLGRGGEIAGFMLLNDWSARDIQMRESSLRMGPHKSKDFCTSIGPWLVTPDELPYVDGRLHLRATAKVNDELITDSDASEQHFSWPEILEHAGRNTVLQPGDVIGSGTLVNGCLMESNGRPDGTWLEPGDVVELHCEHLGTLRSEIVAEDPNDQG